MTYRPFFPLFFAAALLAGCSSPRPYATTVGTLPPGSTMHVQVAQASFAAFAPAVGEPRNRYTVSATAAGKSTPAAPKLRPAPGGVTVDAPDPLANLLVRVPDGVTLVVDSRAGDVHVTNIAGPAVVTADRGNVQIMLQGYAQASTRDGSISVTMGALQWPGTLRFTAERGDVAVSVNETAKFDVHLHTDKGTLFTDFNLRGTSAGDAETIDGPVNGGGAMRIEITTHAGEVRLLKLHPEA